LLSIFFLVLPVGCTKKTPQTRQTRSSGPTAAAVPVPVKTEVVKQKTTSIELSNFGTVEAYSSVELKSQITGILTDVYFTEGQMVKKGDLLISIDPRQPQAALNVAQANLEKDQAQLKNAETDAARQTELLNKGFISQDEYENSITSVDVLKAAVKADKAAVENATLQLDYCSVRSPIDGCTGSLYVQQGNLVRANDTSVVCIKQIKPIYVSFSVPEQYLSSIQKYMSLSSLDVAVYHTGEPQQPIHGSLTFVDNTVDAGSNTRTIRLRATFSNSDGRLWPGQYVNEVLTLTQEPNSIVISSQAVQTGQDNLFVYVVKSDKTVEVRPITVKRALNNETVVDGLKSDEIIVTDGQLRLVPGSRVEIKNVAQNEAVAR
jgi:membrane fusion protein, multidrug efflux system